MFDFEKHLKNFTFSSFVRRVPFEIVFLLENLFLYFDWYIFQLMYFDWYVFLLAFVFCCIVFVFYMCICVFAVFLFLYLCICVCGFCCICVHPSTLSPLTTYSICEAHWPGPWDSDNTQSVLRNPQIYKYIQNLGAGGESWIFGRHLAEVAVNFCPKYLPNWPLCNYWRQQEGLQKGHQSKYISFSITSRPKGKSLPCVFPQMYSCKFIPGENVERQCSGGAILPWVKLSWGSI